MKTPTDFHQQDRRPPNEAQASLAGTPGSAFRCQKCGHIFTHPSGKQWSDGDVEVWCPKCGANDDHWEEGVIYGEGFGGQACPSFVPNGRDEPRRSEA